VKRQRQKAALQPGRTEAGVKGLAPSRTVLGLANVRLEDELVPCHVLSCYHLAPLSEVGMERANGSRPPDGDWSRVQKRRCLACASLEEARPTVRTLLIQRRAAG
jgi:hypothetical protein